MRKYTCKFLAEVNFRFINIAQKPEINFKVTSCTFYENLSMKEVKEVFTYLQN